MFYPTLAYNLARNYIQPQRWQWYSRVDDDLILGALPFRSMVNELKVRSPLMTINNLFRTERSVE